MVALNIHRSLDGFSWQLPRFIGISNTLQLHWSGDRVNGGEEYRLDIARRLVSDGT